MSKSSHKKSQTSTRANNFATRSKQTQKMPVKNSCREKIKHKVQRWFENQVPVQKLEKWSIIAFTGTFPLRGKKEKCGNKPNVNIEKLLLNWTELSF